MTDIDTKPLRELLAKATPGEWEFFDENGKAGVTAPAPEERFIGGYSRLADVAHCLDFFNAERPRAETLANAALIVALHNAAPALLDELDELRAACAMKDSRIDWTVEDNAEKAIELVDLRAANAKLHDAHLGQMKRANDLFVENENLRALDRARMLDFGAVLEENERLREALLEIDRNCCGVPGGFSGKILDVARAALEDKP